MGLSVGRASLHQIQKLGNVSTGKIFVAYLHLIYYDVTKCLLYSYLDIIPTRNTDW